MSNQDKQPNAFRDILNSFERRIAELNARCDEKVASLTLLFNDKLITNREISQLTHQAYSESIKQAIEEIKHALDLGSDNFKDLGKRIGSIERKLNDYENYIKRVSDIIDKINFIEKEINALKISHDDLTNKDKLNIVNRVESLETWKKTLIGAWAVLAFLLTAFITLNSGKGTTVTIGGKINGNSHAVHSTK